MSRAEIRKLTREIRAIAGCENKPYFPIVEFLELVLPKIYPDYEFSILTPAEMGNKHGETFPNERRITLRDDVYLRACNGVGRDRLTAAHELGHLLLHKAQKVSFARIMENVRVPPYMDPEWQAKAFSGELLVDAHLSAAFSAYEIESYCKVSSQAAIVQFNAMRR